MNFLSWLRPVVYDLVFQNCGQQGNFNSKCFIFEIKRHRKITFHVYDLYLADQTSSKMFNRIKYSHDIIWVEMKWNHVCAEVITNLKHFAKLILTVQDLKFL
jgi:hypothetical protein